MSRGWRAAPRSLAPPAGEVHVWRGTLGAAAARLALRRILARYLDEEPAAIELRTGEHGKPALAEQPPKLRFNLSHSDGLALVAVSAEREVGVDVEAETDGRDFARLAEIGLGADVTAAVRAAPSTQRAATFYAAWVRHEALVKCAGTGLGAQPSKLPMSVLDLQVGRGHAAALAVAGDRVPPLRRFAMPPA
jgi:4'-phosphopantetheinyl transferase